MADELSSYAIKSLEGLEQSGDVGRGSFGVASEVKVNGLPCIAKRLHNALLAQDVSRQQRDAIAAKFRSECVLLSRLRHPNIVQFLGVHFGRDRYDLTLVMERMHMDLETGLKKFPNIPLPFRIRILLDVSYGLLHLHSQSPPVVHRDLTAANILLSPDFRAKVADLGVSKILDLSPQQLSKQTQCPGALAYMSPEALRPVPVYGVKLDVFSFGHVALYTANQKFPEVHELGERFTSVEKDFKGGTVQLSRRRIAVDMMGTDHCLYQLIAACLHDSPEQRPTTAQLNSLLQELSAQHPLEDSPTLTATVFEEYMKHEREEHTEAASQHEEEMQRLKSQMKELKKQLIHAEDKRARAEDMMEPIVQVKQRLDDTLEKAQEEVQVKTNQLQQYKKQVDALKKKVAKHEEQSISLGRQMLKVREELEKTKEKAKLERAKSTTKMLKGVAETKVVPEEKYCKLEADYDQALQKIAELQEEMKQREAAYKGLQPSTSTDLDHALLIPEEPPSPRLHARGKTQLTASHPMPRAREKPLSNPRPSPQTHSPSHSPSRPRYPTPPSQPHHAPTIPSQPPPAGPAQPQPPAVTQQLTASRPMPRAREKPLSNPRPSPQTHSPSYSPSRARYPTPPSQPRHAPTIPSQPPPAGPAQPQPPAVTQQLTASRPMPQAREKPLSNPRPSPQTYSPSYSPSRAQYPTPPSQPRHAPTIPSQPPPAGPAQPQQPATSSTCPPERGPSRSKQPSERNQPSAHPPPPQPRGTEQDHLASHQPLFHQQGYLEEREGDVTGLAPRREQPRELQSQAAEPFTQPGGYYPPEDPNMSRGFQPQAAGPYVRQNTGGKFPTGGNEPNQPQIMQSKVAMQLAQQPPRGNFPQGSNEPNIPRGLRSQCSMPFTLRPSDRNLPPGSNHPQRATLLIPEEPPSPRLHARGKTPLNVTQQPTASRPMPQARQKPLSNPRPSPQTHSPSHSPSRPRYPTPPSQPRHAPTIPSQPPPAGPAQPQQPATSSTRPPERGPSRSKQPSERNQPPARPPPPQPRGTEQDHLASRQPLIHQQGYFEEHEGDVTGLAPQREQPREPQSQAAEPFTQPGGYYPPEDPNISRGFQSQAAGSYVQQNAGGNFPTGGNEPQMMQSQVAMLLAQQPPRGNFPQGSNEPNVPRGLLSQRSMPFILQPSDRNLPSGSNHPQRATLPSAYGAPSQPVPTAAAPVADEGRYSISPPDLMSLPEPVVDYREPQFERQSSYPRPEQDYTPHEQPPQSDYGGNNYYLQGQQHHHAQMGISLGLNERRVRGSASPQSVHSPVSPKQHPSPVSPAPLPGHAPSPTRPPLYQSQTAPPLNSSGAQVQVPRPLSSGEATFSLASHEDNDNDRIDTEMKAEPVTYPLPDDHERVTQSHIPFDPNLVCPTCKRQFRYGEIQRFRSHVRECALQEGMVV